MPPDATSPAVPGRPEPSGLRRWVRRVFRVAVMAYLGLCVLLYFAQTWLVFPGAATQGKRQSIVRPGAGEEVVGFPAAGGERVAALYARALGAGGEPLGDAEAGGRPTVLYFYGNGMCANDCGDEVARIRLAGANVLVPDYLGYGMSGGKPSEAGCYATADAAYEYLRAARKVPAGRIVAAGRSLGSGPAVDLAWRKPVGGLATFSAFTSMTAMSRRAAPYFPTSLLLRHRFENERKIAGVGAPTFLAHGTTDPLVPFAMAARLARAAGGPVTRCDVPGGGHDDIFQAGGADLSAAFKAFLDANFPPGKEE